MLQPHHAMRRRLARGPRSAPLEARALHHPTLTMPARLACNGRPLMMLLAIVIETCERCVQRSQNVPSLTPQPPLPRVFLCASLALTAPAPRRSVIEPALLCMASASRAPRPVAHREHVSHVRPRVPHPLRIGTALLALQPCSMELIVRLPCMSRSRWWTDTNETPVRVTCSPSHAASHANASAHLSMHMPLHAHICI